MVIFNIRGPQYFTLEALGGYFSLISKPIFSRMQVTMQVPVVCFLFTEERSEGFVKFSRIGFKIFCFPLPVFLDNLSSVFCSNVPPPSLYFTIFICSVVCILLGIFSFKFNCIFPTRCHVWDGQFSKPHCFSGRLCYSTTGVK